MNNIKHSDSISNNRCQARSCQPIRETSSRATVRQRHNTVHHASEMNTATFPAILRDSDIAREESNERESRNIREDRSVENKEEHSVARAGFAEAVGNGRGNNEIGGNEIGGREAGKRGSKRKRICTQRK